MPWPWSINAAGQSTFFASKAQAVAAVQALQASGVQSIDVGCMQINLQQHPHAFASLDEAFDPEANVRYAARFLGLLYERVRAWPQAAALYHSATPELGEAYRRKVMAAWPLGAAAGAAVAQQSVRSPVEQAWAATHEDIATPKGKTPLQEAWAATLCCTDAAGGPTDK